MMDFQSQINNMMAANRAKSMLNSSQLTLGELILKFEAIKNKNLPVYLHNLEHKPTGFSSWRGSYCELAINYDGESGSFREPPKDDCQKGKYSDHSYDCPCGRSSNPTHMEEPTGQVFLDMLNKIKGKAFRGWKGGDFLMGKSTPLWVANIGESSGFLENDNYDCQAVIDIQENENEIIIVTSLMEC